jgi:hypothetical protein
LSGPVSRNSFSVREIDQDFIAFRRGNHQLCGRDGGGQKSTIRCYDVKGASIFETQVKILRVSSIEQP